ncbi:hypothetical protein [Acinetobacter sp. FDAARGOS_558]|nr:hypothetical protein [Acinetobacter sp. FDAARGOS_558]
MPIAGYATLQDGKIHIEGRVGSVDGQTLLGLSLQMKRIMLSN